VGEITMNAVRLADGSNQASIQSDVVNLNMDGWTAFSEVQIRNETVKLDIESIGKTWVSASVMGITLSIPVKLKKSAVVRGMHALEHELFVKDYELVHKYNGKEGLFVKAHVELLNPSQVSLSPLGVLSSDMRYEGSTIATLVSTEPLDLTPGKNTLEMVGQITHGSSAFSNFSLHVLDYLGRDLDTSVHFNDNASDIEYFNVALRGLVVDDVQIQPVTTSVVREIQFLHQPNAAELAAWYKKDGRLIMPGVVGFRNPFAVPIVVTEIHSGWSAMDSANETMVEYARIDHVFEKGDEWHVKSSDLTFLSPPLPIEFDALPKSEILAELAATKEAGASLGVTVTTFHGTISGVPVRVGPLTLPDVPVCLQEDADKCESMWPV
jgi:hypothetical protein